MTRKCSCGNDTFDCNMMIVANLRIKSNGDKIGLNYDDEGCVIAEDAGEDAYGPYECTK